jgi:preprotein translocase subunit SecG
MAKTNDDPKEKKESKEEREPKEKKGSNKTVIFILLGVIIILLLAIVIILLLQKKENNPEVSDTGEGREVAGSIRTVASEEDARNIMDEMRESVAEGMFACNMSMEWNFVNGGKISRDAYVANDPDNTHPICFDVYLEGTGELIYSSPVLKVGTVWSDFSLDKTLEAGTYEAKVQYSLLKDEETQETISQANFIITINVLD